MWIQSSLSSQMSKNIFARYAVTLTATLSTLLVCRVLHPFIAGYVALILLFPAVAFASWYGGLSPSLLTVAIAVAGARYWFIPPVHSLRIPEKSEAIGLLAFFFASSLVVVMGEARRREGDKLRMAQGQLEERVRERTVELATANQSLRQLSARLLQLQDDERRRIARELHDSIGQMLVGLTMNLSGVRSDIERLTKSVAALTDSEALVQEMTREVRTISHLLHPPLLDEAGLASAVRWYVDGFAQRSKIKVDLELADDFGRLTPELETTIFRVVQECLTNVHRHSGSSIAKVRIARSNDMVFIEVADRGRGIPPEKKHAMSTDGAPGVGIRGMRERVRQLGGSLEIKSVGDGHGTVVVASLPYATTSSTAAA
jgi:signal transduction histidine kinase